MSLRVYVPPCVCSSVYKFLRVYVYKCEYCTLQCAPNTLFLCNVSKCVWYKISIQYHFTLRVYPVITVSVIVYYTGIYQDGVRIRSTGNESLACFVRSYPYVRTMDGSFRNAEKDFLYVVRP